MYPDDLSKPRHLSVTVADLAETPPTDAVRQTVLDTAARHPGYDYAEVHELLGEMGRPIALGYVAGRHAGPLRNETRRTMSILNERMAHYEMVRGDERISLRATTRDAAEAEATKRSADLPGCWVLFRNGVDMSWSGGR